MIDKIYYVLSVIPLIALKALVIYMGRLEGWGAWAVAPTILPIAIASLALGGVGITLCVRAGNRGKPVLAPMLATLVAGSVGLWFLVSFWAEAL